VIRQRIKLRTPALAYAARAMALVLGLALFWYGLMVVLLAVKVSPHTINSLSDYRTLYDDAVRLRASDFTTAVRLIAGFAALIAFLLFLYLAAQELPRPYLARGDLKLAGEARGETLVKPRAIERVAELAAQADPDVASAAGRLGDQELTVSIVARRAAKTADTLTEVHQRIIANLQRHDLPTLPINVTLTGYDGKTRRELS
jgi:hypothetical protein